MQRLLIDISPERRGINLNPDKAVESAKSAALDERANQVDRELLRLAAGHPDTAVQRSARDLSSAIVRAAYATEWYVRDVAARRDSAEVLAEAQRAYAEVMDAAEKLEQAVKQAGSR